jgi:hypothetical protein
MDWGCMASSKFQHPDSILNSLVTLHMASENWARINWTLRKLLHIDEEVTEEDRKIDRYDF